MKAIRPSSLSLGNLNFSCLIVLYFYIGTVVKWVKTIANVLLKGTSLLENAVVMSIFCLSLAPLYSVLSSKRNLRSLDRMLYRSFKLEDC